MEKKIFLTSFLILSLSLLAYYIYNPNNEELALANSQKSKTNNFSNSTKMTYKSNKDFNELDNLKQELLKTKELLLKFNYNKNSLTSKKEINKLVNIDFESKKNIIQEVGVDLSKSTKTLNSVSENKTLEDEVEEEVKTTSVTVSSYSSNTKTIESENIVSSNIELNNQVKDYEESILISEELSKLKVEISDVQKVISNINTN